ncbi:MAG: processing protein [Solirubrobacterales bacterium]|jgi:DNA processing protein|nr:processing protein [Solirubrobacterales bacterium]
MNAPIVWELGRDANDYPPMLHDLNGNEQPHLYGVGDRAALARLRDEPAVTIVGARRASSYGLRVAEDLARDLALAGVTVVSGMALGIDSAAHRGALAGAGTTIAVLAGGPDRASPPSNRGLHGELAATGAVISEHPPGSRVEPRHFAQRNRIMAALGEVVVIVEAAQPSGSLITADVALKLGRTVGAVPGQLGVRVAEGSNDLLRDGAHLIRDARDVLDLLFGVGLDGPGTPRRAPAPRPGPALDPELGAILELVRGGAATVDRLVADGRLDPRRAAVALARLELLGYVRGDLLGAYAPTGLRAPE